MNVKHIFTRPLPPGPEQIEREKLTHAAFLQFATTLDGILLHTQDSEACFELLRQARDKAIVACEANRSVVDINVLSRLFKPIEEKDQLVGRVYFNVMDYADIRKFCRGILDIETKAENMRKGIQGRLWLAEIRIHRKIPLGYALVIPEHAMENLDFNPEEGPDPTRLTRIV
jgi:hypothetical protein